MVTGRALYSMGAALWNDLSPAYFNDIMGTCSRCWSLHLNCHLTCLGTIVCDRNRIWYNGGILWRTLYIKHKTLNSICSCMGNQSSWWRTGVICSYRLVSITILCLNENYQMHEQLYSLPLYPEGFFNWGSDDLVIELTWPSYSPHCQRSHPSYKE